MYGIFWVVRPIWYLAAELWAAWHPPGWRVCLLLAGEPAKPVAGMMLLLSGVIDMNRCRSARRSLLLLMAV